MRLLLYKNDMKMENVNVHFTRESTQSQEEAIEGEWYTEVDFKALKDGVWTPFGSQITLLSCHELRQMVTNALDWARQRRLVRTSPIHGQEEFKIPLKFAFKNADLNKFSQVATGSTQLQAGSPMT